MPVYMVGFDVRNCGGQADYAGLQNSLSKLERHRLMPWLYLVSVPFTAGALKDYLLAQMSDSDCLWVSRVPAKANLEFAYQTIGGTSAWLKKYSRIELPPPVNGSASENLVYQCPNRSKMRGGNSVRALHS